MSAFNKLFQHKAHITNAVQDLVEAQKLHKISYPISRFSAKLKHSKIIRTLKTSQKVLN